VNPTLVTTTEAVDKAFYVILGICVVMLVGIAVAMIWFAWRYNRKRQPQPLSQKDTNLWLEVIWTIIPTLLVCLMFWYGWEGYLSLRKIPDDAMHVKVSARKWSWLFTYDNGKTSDKLYVPVGQPVKVELLSEDVLHSFYVPAFRVKRDTVPGMVNYAWFVAEKPGSYDLFCAEYCGVGHSAMVTTVEALPKDDFIAWLQKSLPETHAKTGKELLQQYGCLGCHSLDGSRMVGPTLKGLAGKQVEVEKAGVEVTLTRDRAYFKRALLEPEVEIVDDYPPAMPSYTGRLSDADLESLLDFLTGVQSATLNFTPTAAPQKALADEAQRGAALAREQGCLGCHSVDGYRALGPTLFKLAGSSRIVLRDGKEQTVVADADYLRRALLQPQVEIVSGYPPAMPTYDQLDAADIDALVLWLQGLER